MASHKKKSDKEWKRDLTEYAITGKFGRGQAPSKKDKIWHDEYTKVKACPITEQKNLVGNNTQGLFGMSRKIKCTCGYDHTKKNNTNNTNTTAAPTATTQSPPVIIPFGIPQKPQPKTSKFEVENVSNTIIKKGYFNLTIFAYTSGRCPHCNSTDIVSTSINSRLKIIHTLKEPRFIQGCGMKCNNPDCNGRGWQTYESTYVATLKKHLQQELNAIIVGASDGIDLDMLTQMRNGATAASIVKSSNANLVRWHDQLHSKYVTKCNEQINLGINVQVNIFPPLDPSWSTKSAVLLRGYLRDYLGVRDLLNREMAAILSEHALAMDHQYKCVKHAQGNDATQSFAVVGDGNLVIGYYAVPNPSLDWVKDALKEIVQRHGGILDDNSRKVIERGQLPPVMFVDTGCCNGQLGGRNEANKMFYGMLKKLDTFHLINRVGREMNAEHPRKGNFLKLLSNCIFTRSKEDMDRLEAARAQGNINKLTSSQQKSDRTKHVRRVIADPVEIVTKMMFVVKGQIAIDRKAKLTSQQSGDPCIDINTAHMAYPLITKKVLKALQLQCIHILNGCVHDESAMNVQTGEINYRNTGIMLPTYMSLRGSSKVEVLHSIMDRVFYCQNNIRQLYFDAKAHWAITNYNRARLRELDKPALPPGVAPSEVNASTINIAPHTDLRFGFDYCRSVLNNIELETQQAAIELVESADLQEVLETPIAIDDVIVDDDDDIDQAADVATTISEDGMSPLTTNIPPAVDFESLSQVVDELMIDIDSGTTSLPPAAGEIGAREADVAEAFGSTATLEGCLNNADAIGREAGIDVERHFVDTGINRFKNARAASSIRNVGLRRQQDQDTPNVPPDFNEPMRKKWSELWVAHPNPSTGAAMRTWYQDNNVRYERWRNERIQAAVTDGTTAPPLHKVGYTHAKEWADSMKAAASKPLRDGAIDEETQMISNAVSSFINSTDGVQNTEQFTSTGIGNAVIGNQLNVSLPVPTAGDAPTFANPTSQTIHNELHRKHSTSSSKAKKVKKRKREPTPVPPELQERRDRAVARMSNLGLVQANRQGDKRRCQVCFQLLSEPMGETPHVQLAAAKKGVPIPTFCPFADDPAIYIRHLEEKKRKNTLKARQKRARKLARKNSSVNTE